MVEFFFMILGYLISIPALIIILLIATYQESCEKHGWSAFLMIVSLAIVYFLFDIKTSHALIAVAAYIPIGLVWSIVRWKIYCTRKVDQLKDYFTTAEDEVLYRSETYSQTTIDNLNVRRNLDKLTYWVICWPVSMVERAIGDLVHAVRHIITNWFGSVFERISNSAISDINEFKETIKKPEQTVQRTKVPLDDQYDIDEDGDMDDGRWNKVKEDLHGRNSR